VEEKPKRKRTHKKKNNDNNKLKKSHFDVEREKRFIRNEERDIKKYEKMLKLKNYTKRSRLPKSFYLDGLGELIEICDRKQYDNRIEVSDDGIDFAGRENLGKKKKKKEEEQGEEIEFDEEDDEVDEQEMNDDESVEGEDEEIEEMNSEIHEDVEGEEGDDFDDEEEEDDEVEEEQPKITKTKPKKLNKDGFYEDIYGFIRDKDGNIVKPDQPDHQQQKQDILNSNVTVDEQIQRKLRGLLNRLTADNIKVISREIVDLYRNNSRAVINQGLLNCVEKSLIGLDYQVPSKLASEFAILVAVLHTELGEEVGAFFVHAAIRHFDVQFQDPTRWTESKQLNNTLVLIINLYATGLIDSAVIYDILDKFCVEFSNEKSIEIIDFTLKNSGFMLRKDDASKMKSLIMRIQELSSDVDLSGLSGSRIKFILDSLTAIKNNNVAKLRVNDPLVLGELIESTLKSVIKRARVSTIPGQYAAVIQSAHWFSFTRTIVPLDAINAKEATTEEKQVIMDDNNKIDYALRDKLCRKLRINTPLRKDLFTVLLQCSDYLDAACRLISVGKKQFSEVINVVLHVAINEKCFNQFYFHLLQHLTTCDRKYKVE